MMRNVQRGVFAVQSALFVYLAIDRAAVAANVGTSFRTVAIAGNAILAVGFAILACVNQRSRAVVVGVGILEVAVLAWVGGNLGTFTLIEFALALAILLLLIFRGLQSRNERAEA
jgi:hypothetical protein